MWFFSCMNEYGQVLTPNKPTNLSGVIDSIPSTGANKYFCRADETTAFPGGATQDNGVNLPINCVRTDVANRPSPGSVINVTAGSATAFQNALNTVICGQSIVLQAGSIYTGSFTLPAHNCDNAHWITIRTSDMVNLPPEGSRALPCHAGVQLPSRDPYPAPGNCSKLVNAMAKIKGNGALDETLRIAANADHYSFIGIEVEIKDTARTAQTQNLINMLSGTGNHFVFDRVWLHGLADRATVRAGFMQTGVSYVALIDSSVTDIHCIANVCTDSQIFQGGNGGQAFLAANNYVESAGTNSMSFGGLPATVMPTDFMWLNNYQVKPMSWNPACIAPLPPSCRLSDGTMVTYDGLGPYPVKNQLEVKGVIRVLVQGNTMYGNWMRADQNASAIVLTPKNQSGNQCPLCVLQYVVIRYNHIITSGGFLQAANAPADDGGLATRGSDYSIHDNLVENLNFLGVVNTGFNFTVFGIQTWTSPNIACGNSFIQKNVKIFHNTLVMASGRNYNAMHQMDGPLGACESGMEFRDNIAFYGSQGVNQVSNSACSGPTSTNFTPKYGMVNSSNVYVGCWPSPYLMTKNIIISGQGTWPTGNLLLTLTQVQFVNYNNGAYGDYHLLATSPGHNAGTDGKDIGADINLVLSMTAGHSPWN